MCQKHQWLLLQQIGIGPTGPWRSHILSAQITLFQGTTPRLTDVRAQLPGLGCLACHGPDLFGEVVQAMQQGGIAQCKALGEKWAMKSIFWLSFVEPATQGFVGCIVVEGVTTLNAAWLKALLMADISPSLQVAGAELNAADFVGMDPGDLELLASLPRNTLLSIEQLRERGIRVEQLAEPSKAVH